MGVGEATKAVVVFTSNNQPVAGVIVRLNANDACGPRYGSTNADGYVKWDNFPDAVLDSDVAIWTRIGDPVYVQQLTGATRLHTGNQTIRIGVGGPINEGDVILPALDARAPEPTPVPGPTPSGDFPPPPSREQVCAGQQHFQGVTWATAEWGMIPLFSPFILSAGPASRQSAYHTLKDLGDTKLGLAWTYQYASPNQAYRDIPGRDFTSDAALPEFIDLLIEVIQAGFYPDIFMGGDGQSNATGGYNDPVGWTYGHQWLMHNLPRLISALAFSRVGDLLQYVQLIPGYDAIMTPNEGSWQPSQLDDYLVYARSLVGPKAYLGLEFGAPYCHWGRGRENYTTTGQHLDTIYLELFYPAGGDPLWQPAARMLGPHYNRPPEEPAGDDDQGPVYYLEGGTPRGPWYVNALEDGLYEWVRNQVSHEDLQREAESLYRVGYGLTGFGNR